jgi:chitin disaccharide deacetylase
VRTLAERLGYAADDRLVIVSADRLGTCHAANVGIYRALRDGVATASALMMPCPWARHAMFDYRGEDIGVALTLNAEHDLVRWGPLTHAPSLLDGDGGFPRTLADLWDHADLDEVRRECRAQIERAIVWGFGVTHLTSHLDALVFRPEFFDIYLDLACEFGLPIRLGGPEAERAAGFPVRSLAADEGVTMPDRVVAVRGGADALVEALPACTAGVTELIVEPALDTPELQAIDPTAGRDRGEILHALLHASGIDDVLADHRIRRIGYRQLREAQAREHTAR